MVAIDTEYCVPCGPLAAAIETQYDLLGTFGRDLAGVRLVPGHGGVFRVSVDGETVPDSDDDTDALADAVRTRLEAR